MTWEHELGAHYGAKVQSVNTDGEKCQTQKKGGGVKDEKEPMKRSFSCSSDNCEEQFPDYIFLNL